MSTCPQCGCEANRNVIDAGVEGGPVQKSTITPIMLVILGVLVWLSVQGGPTGFLGQEYVIAAIILSASGLFWWRSAESYNRERFPAEWARWTRSRVCDDCGTVFPGDQH